MPAIYILFSGRQRLENGSVSAFTIDSEAPGADHGMDTDAGGYGTVNTEQ
jgi:hypothetical protein